MAKKFNNNEIKSLGFKEETLVKAASNIARYLLNEDETVKGNKAAVFEILKDVLANPIKYQENRVFFPLLHELKKQEIAKATQNPAMQVFENQSFNLAENPITYAIYGKEGIEKDAITQMNMAMRLPISVAGALMPDAHPGYGLPIGGVLATTNNTVIPYAVGVDIACRMCLSVFDIEGSYYVENKKHLLKSYLEENTIFGINGRFHTPLQDDLFDSVAWNDTKLLRSLREKAIQQVGTSGTGNHFVEFGILEVSEITPEIPLPKGKYLALLSHSGSRGFGATIAGHYSKLAMDLSKLPKEAKHLAWLDRNTEEGMEYWLAMNLAGEYAAANHEHIHRRMAKSLNTKAVLKIENHHNFAWEETLADGTQVIVHRKGATPAHAGSLGIIPGTMATPAYVVKGKGEQIAIHSASHGAGRLMSRNKALTTFTKSEVKKVLSAQQITLIGGDLDEAPMVYKDIEQVMQAQTDLVEILAKFHPKVVRMADADRKQARED
jgi:tRNA-splicing ligase RtcB